MKCFKCNSGEYVLESSTDNNVASSTCYNPKLDIYCNQCNAMFDNNDVDSLIKLIKTFESDSNNEIHT